MRVVMVIVSIHNRNSKTHIYCQNSTSWSFWATLFSFDLKTSIRYWNIASLHAKGVSYRVRDISVQVVTCSPSDPKRHKGALGSGA